MWGKLQTMDCSRVRSCRSKLPRCPHELRIIWKAACLLTILYIFTCSLDLLSRGFRLISGKHTGFLFRWIVKIPEVKLAGVMIGILTTVILHSSSTSTSIVVALVISETLQVREAIPIVMGANIGTSITTSISTLISFPKAGQVEEFRLAFSCATLHSMFNWCSVVALVIIENFFRYLERTSESLTDILVGKGNGTKISQINFLSIVTKPVVNLIVQINDTAIKCYSDENASKEGKGNSSANSNCTHDYPTLMKENSSPSFFPHVVKLPDEVIGIMISIIAITSVVSCLLLNVKILKSILQGPLATKLAIKINAEIPYIPWLAGYLAILIGTGSTMLIQSSSVFTSAVATVVGVDFLTLNRAYPLTLGANIGTTTTALMTALASADCSKKGVQIALCHLIFNLTGAILFYPIPFLRLPITMAMYLGQRTAMYRWFSVAFMALMFLIGPILFMILSYICDGILAYLTAGMIIALILFFICVNKMREECPDFLPDFYTTWKWLPLWIRSLEPYDKFVTSCCSKVSQLVHKSSRTLPVVNQDASNENYTTNRLGSMEMARVNSAFDHQE